MDTLIIRLLDEPGGGFVVQLHIDGGAAAVPAVVAAEPLPADLDQAAAPPVLGSGALDDAVVAFVEASGQSDAFTPIGEWLAGLVFRGSVAAAWDERVAKGGAIRTLLEVQPAKLARLPWELMRRGSSRLFVDAGHPFACALELECDAIQELVPLRLLVVEGSDDPALATASELGGITAALPAFGGRVQRTVLSEPDQATLWDAFRRVRPHVLHFAGHGLVDKVSGLPALRVGDWFLTRDHILDVMPYAPRVAVLNACRTNEGSVDQIQALTSAFLSRKTAAVIAMRGDIGGRSAALFGAELYKGLAQAKLLDEATASARQTVYGEVGAGAQRRDWFLPRLTLRVRPEQVLPLTCGCALSSDDVYEIETKLFEPTRLFVGRGDERFDLVDLVDPDEGAPRRVLIVQGAMEMGKTWLANWVRTRCALRGRRVRYVDLKGLRTLKLLEALDVIRTTPEDVPSLAPEPGSYDRYLHDLGYLLKSQLPPEPGTGQPVQAPAIGGKLELGPDDIRRIFESFRAGLERETEHEPLLLIFDHVDGMLRDDFHERVYPLLIRKIADGHPPNVRVLVVLSAEQRRSYWPDERRIWSELDVDPIDPCQFQPLAREVLYLMGTEVGQMHIDLIDAMKAGITGGWSPTRLKPLITVVGSWGR